MGKLLDRERHEMQAAFARVEELEAIAEQAPEVAPRVRRVARGILRDLPGVRPAIAAELLGLNEKSVRAWVYKGILTSVNESPVVLDAERLHEVFHIVMQLRDAGRQRGLLEAVWHQLEDDELLARDDLQESLAQMRRGEVIEI